MKSDTPKSDAKLTPTKGSDTTVAPEAAASEADLPIAAATAIEGAVSPNTFPELRPETPLLDRVNVPADLRDFSLRELNQLAQELRQFLLYSVSKSGGHFGAGLGVVELTVALHAVLNTPHDRLVWDVGHQSYPHKILTGRRDAMASIRQANGLAGFPKRQESEFDTFGVGHSSTSISAALGMALAAKLKDEERESVAVIGDGAMTAGMAFEALNHAASTGSDLLVVLNDNEMSISKNVGGLANYFSKIWASETYTSFREGGKKVLNKLPATKEFVRKTEEHMKGMISPATLFEELGFYYVGPIDGHNMERLIKDLKSMLKIKGPKLLHVITQKGRGFLPAEADPVGFHALGKLEPAKASAADSKALKFQDVFGQWLCASAEKDEKLIGITPAMCEGSGMATFSERFAERFYDVAIAEQHAVTLAAGLACEGLKPVVAIYSTFLQRAYDQLIHDVAIQDLDVLFAIDRAGVVGEDGPTHAGSFDLSFLRCIPNLVVAAPSSENECYQLLSACYLHEGPAAVRYPRGKGPGDAIQAKLTPPAIGKARIAHYPGWYSENKKPKAKLQVGILVFGPLLSELESLCKESDYLLVDMRWVKPLDEALLRSLINFDLIVTVEDNTIAGGAGSACAEWFSTQPIIRTASAKIIHCGLPDHFQEHGTRKQLLQEAGLDAKSIQQSIESALEK